MTVSYEAIEIPAEAKHLDPVSAEIKAEPAAPIVPNAGTYGASDLRAKVFALYAIELRKWGRGLVSAIEARELGQAELIENQTADRAAALARLSALRETSENEAE